MEVLWLIEKRVPRAYIKSGQIIHVKTMSNITKLCNYMDEKMKYFFSENGEIRQNLYLITLNLLAL